MPRLKPSPPMADRQLAHVQDGDYLLSTGLSLMNSYAYAGVPGGPGPRMIGLAAAHFHAAVRLGQTR